MLGMNGLKATSTHRSNVARLKLLFGPPLTRSMSFEEAPRQWGDLRMRSSWRLGASKHHGISAHWAHCTIPSQFLGMKQYLCMDQVIKNDVVFFDTPNSLDLVHVPCVSVVFYSCIAFFTTSFWESCNILQLLRCCF